jgi:broad specificity phosphatase PhoE
MDSRTIVLVQHAEKEPGVDDPGLTPKGERQARACAQHLGNHVCGIFSSPARRCLATAEAIADIARLQVRVDEGLAERMTWVPSSGLSFDAFLAEWDQASRDRDFTPSTGRSSRATGVRMAEAIRRLAEASPPGTIACVTHGGATVDLLRDLVGDDGVIAAGPDLITSGVPGGALTTIVMTSARLRPIEIAASAHLDGID